MSGYYILDADGTPQPESDRMTWGEWYMAGGIDARRVALTEVAPGISVSTVFLSIDHGWGGTPMLFESMVFGGPLDQECDRCSTREQALAQHEAMVARVRVAGES